MSPFHLVCDSTADIEASEAAARDIAVVPLRVIFGDDEMRDGVDISTDGFYARMRTDPRHPRTSQPTPTEFEEVFRRVGADGAPIVCTTISARLSGTYASAMQARAALPDLDIRVVDTRTVGPGHYAAVAIAVAIRDRAGTADQALIALSRLQAEQRLVFTLETLEFLHRGGRIGGARAFLGTLLSVKPILAIRDGQVEAVGRVRTYQRALDRLVGEVAEVAKGWGRATAIAAHAANPAQAAVIASRLAEITGEMPPVLQVGAVLGCHAGPGAFGIAMHPAALLEG